MAVRFLLRRETKQPTMIGRTTLHALCAPGFDCELIHFSLDGGWVNLRTLVPIPRIRARSIRTGRQAEYVYRVPRRDFRMEGFE